VYKVQVSYTDGSAKTVDSPEFYVHARFVPQFSSSSYTALTSDVSLVVSFGSMPVSGQLSLLQGTTKIYSVTVPKQATSSSLPISSRGLSAGTYTLKLQPDGLTVAMEATASLTLSAPVHRDIVITSPTAGTTLYRGTGKVDIRLAVQNVPSLSLYLKHSGTGKKTTITPSLDTKQNTEYSLSFAIPAAQEVGEYTVLAENTGYGISASSAAFSIAEAPVVPVKCDVKVTSPVTGASWKVGLEQTITFTSHSSCTSFSVVLVNGEKEWSIASSTAQKSVKYTPAASVLTGVEDRDSYVVRVTAAADGSTVDSPTFTISPDKRLLKFLAPAEGAIWNVGDTATVSVQVTDASTDEDILELALLRNGKDVGQLGSSRTLEAKVLSKVFYVYGVPLPSDVAEDTKYSIRARLLDSAGGTLHSELTMPHFFTIQRKSEQTPTPTPANNVTVTSPSAGEVVRTVTTPLRIYWSSSLQPAQPFLVQLYCGERLERVLAGEVSSAALELETYLDSTVGACDEAYLRFRSSLAPYVYFDSKAFKIARGAWSDDSLPAPPLVAPTEPTEPEGPEQPDTPEGPDNPDVPSNPDLPDVPDSPDLPEEPPAEDVPVHVYSPNSASIWRLGETVTVRWKTTHPASLTATVLLYQYSGSTLFLRNTFSRTAPNTGAFMATLPASLPTGSRYLVRVRVNTPDLDWNDTQEFEVRPQAFAMSLPAVSVEVSADRGVHFSLDDRALHSLRLAGYSQSSPREAGVPSLGTGAGEENLGPGIYLLEYGEPVWRFGDSEAADALGMRDSSGLVGLKLPREVSGRRVQGDAYSLRACTETECAETGMFSVVENAAEYHVDSAFVPGSGSSGFRWRSDRTVPLGYTLLALGLAGFLMLLIK